MADKNLPDSKSLFPYYGHDTDGSAIEDAEEDNPHLSMAELWNKLHSDRCV